MIHKFVANDNKGNVNILEVGSDYTKIGNLVDPVKPGDAVSKGYLAGGNILIVNFYPDEEHSVFSSGYGTAEYSNEEIANALMEGKRVFGRMYFNGSQDTAFEINSASIVDGYSYPAIYGFCPAIGYQIVEDEVEEGEEVTSHIEIDFNSAAWLIMPNSDEPTYQFAYRID